jgi:hypothetical protein
MTRRLADPDYRRQQLHDLYAPHVKAVNKLVDELRVDEHRWVPYIAPLHAGVMTRLLLVVDSPGPAPLSSGRAHDAMLGVEGDDAVSARLGALLKRSAIDVADTMVWGAFPWYAEQPVTSAETRAGVEPLRRVVELLESLEVVVLLGKVAERTWRTLATAHPDDLPYAQVLTTTEVDDADGQGTKAERHQRREQQAEVFAQAGRLLRGD